MDYIHLGSPRFSKSGKTKIWAVVSWRDDPLGEIKWYAQWRRYCFYPLGDTTYDCDCLLKLANFCNDQTREHLS